MKCQILFSGKNKKNIINLSSAENAQRVVKVKGRVVELSHFTSCQRTSKWSKSTCPTKIYLPEN